MGLDVRRAVAHLGIGRGVPAVKAIPGKGQDLLPQRPRLLRSETGPGGRRPLAPCHELVLQLGHLLSAELDAAAQLVGLGPTEAGDLDRDAQDLFLEDQHPLGRGQDRLERGMKVAHRLEAPVAPHERAGHAAQAGTGLEKSIGHRQVVGCPCAQFVHRGAHARRLALKDADRIGAQE